MKELRFENLYSPEYYFEIPGYDSRIAIMKLNDARDTMGFSLFSLSYIDLAHIDSERTYANIIHLRNAINDLNSSFDLILQIPWFFYRIWNNYNTKGRLRNRKLKNTKNIVRCSSNWVVNAERECSIEKVVKYLSNKSNKSVNDINKFYKTYISNNAKPFTVRSLCNAMKHNHSLRFEETYSPYNFILNINGSEIDFRKTKRIAKFSRQIVNKNDNKICGKINYLYDNDLFIDIEYNEGDKFVLKDCCESVRLLKLSDVYAECCNYYDALVDLFEIIYNDIYPQLVFCPIWLPKTVNLK